MRKLTGREQQVLEIIRQHDAHGVMPSEIARLLASARSQQVSWQEASKVSSALADLGLVKRRRLPKMTLYHLSSMGRGYTG